MRKGYCTLSLKLDSGNFKGAHIGGKMVREMWFRGDPIYVKKSPPTVSLELVKDTEESRIKIIGRFDDYENQYRYYNVVAHGLLYILKSRLGTRILTVNTSGKTRVNFAGYKTDGSYVYNLEPSSEGVQYVARAFMYYENELTGEREYVYSNPITFSYSALP